MGLLCSGNGEDVCQISGDRVSLWSRKWPGTTAVHSPMVVITVKGHSGALRELTLRHVTLLPTLPPLLLA